MQKGSVTSEFCGLNKSLIWLHSQGPTGVESWIDKNPEVPPFRTVSSVLMEFLESHDDTLGQVRTSASSCYEISTEVCTVGSQVFFCLNITWVCVLVSGKCEQEGVLDKLEEKHFPRVKWDWLHFCHLVGSEQVGGPSAVAGFATLPVRAKSLQSDSLHPFGL